jgi:hypothetical protein
MYRATQTKTALRIVFRESTDLFRSWEAAARPRAAWEPVEVRKEDDQSSASRCLGYNAGLIERSQYGEPTYDMIASCQ